MWKIFLIIFINLISSNETFDLFFCNRYYKNRNIEPRIISGSYTKNNEIPYQAALEYHFLFYSFHICGAVLIKENIVLTAAHCVDVEKLHSIRIRAGTIYKKCGGQLSTISKYIIHPKYNQKTLDYDIAILHLYLPFKINYFTNIIDLIDKEPLTGSIGKISGWGKTSDTTIANRLMYAKVKISDRNQCKTDFQKTKYMIKITSRMICAKGEKTEDACQGDSGGPLTINGKLAGLVSAGIGCGSSYLPGIYTNIAYFKDFIKKNI